MRILAWARTDHGVAIGSPAVLSYPTTETGNSGWSHLGWHEIEHGGWNAELASLSWVLNAEPGESSGRGSIALTRPGRLPELFRERVAASIAVQQFFPISGDRGITVTARRDLSEGGGVSWHATLTRGLTWRTEGVRDTAEHAIARLRIEYDASSGGW